MLIANKMHATDWYALPGEAGGHARRGGKDIGRLKANGVAPQPLRVLVVAAAVVVTRGASGSVAQEDTAGAVEGGLGNTAVQMFQDCPSCPQVIAIPAGTYRMGCVTGTACGSDELPVHEVRVPSFALSKHEVTFEGTIASPMRRADASGRPRSGPRAPARDRGFVGRGDDVRMLAV